MRRHPLHIIVFVTIAVLLAGCGPSDDAAPARAVPTPVTQGAIAVDAIAANTAPLGTAAASTPTDARQEMVLRWNAVANQWPVDLPAPFGRVTFNWDGEHFPHPTFKGGSAQAYAVFGKVLLAFLQQEGTFDFLAANQLFTANLPAGIPGGPQGPESGWNLRELVAQFSMAGPLGAPDEATRAAMLAIGQRIAAITPAPVEPSPPPLPPGMLDAIARWNAVADQMPVTLPAPFGSVTFHWDGEHFPHPTFKGGSAQAYEAFADVLLAFLAEPGNFELLKANRLFTANLRSGVPGPQGPDQGWTLADLARDFASRQASGDHEKATTSALTTLSQRIDAIVYAEPAPPAAPPPQAGG